MEKKTGNHRRTERYRQILVIAAGILFLLAVGATLYVHIRNAIVESEKASLRSLAEVNARSLQASLKAKENLIYAVFSAGIEQAEDVEIGLLRMGERGSYIPLEELETRETWEQEACAAAAGQPGEVAVGPVRETEQGTYVLYMTKAVDTGGSIAGYVQVELDLDEIYAQEQGLSALQAEGSRDCLVKNAEGVTVMPGGAGDGEELALTRETRNGCMVEWVYEAGSGAPVRSRKLIAYASLTVGAEAFSLYIIEDYDEIVRPIEQIAFYFCLLGAAVLLWTSGLLYRMTRQQREQALLVRELQHEKTLNETMKRQEGLMQKYNHSKTMNVLIGAIAHEFNNLMTPVVLYADLLEENETVRREMPEEVRELRSTAARCEELASQLLSYSRQGRAEKVLTDYDATYAVWEAVNMVKKLLPEKVSLREELCRTPYFIHGQVGAMNQILLNLTLNAVHAMPEGGTLHVQFGLSLDDERTLRLVVEDTGCGIAPEIRQQIFQPFFTTKQAGEGTGIGLTVVRRLTEEHGGRVRVQSTPGKGTTFILDFPRVEEKRAEEKPEPVR